MPERTPLQTQDLRARDYLRPIVRRKWLILLVAVLATGGAYAYYVRQPAVYEASTKIYIASDASPLATAAQPTTDRTVQNQATLLKSRDVAAAVATRLGRRSEAAALAASITASPSTGSDFVLITARRPDAKEAALVANAFARAFVQIRSQAQRAEITKALQETRSQLSQLPPKASNAAQRGILNDNIRQLQLTLAVPSGSASQIDPAVPPASSIAPRPIRSALYALALSLLATIGLAFALECFDRRLRSIEEVTPLYDLPTLAVLPHSKDVAFSANDHAALGPAFKESFRQLRTNIELAALDRPLKRILVTSAVASEGKSIVVRNLAIAFRESGLRVAVVDADLRRPTLVQLFGVAGAEHGLTDVLTGRESLHDALVTVRVEARGLGTLAQIRAARNGALANGDGGPKADFGAEAARSPWWTRRAQSEAGPARGWATAAPSESVRTVSEPARAISASEPGEPAEEISFLAPGPQPANPQAVLAADRTRVVLEEVGAQHDIVLIDSPPLLVVSDAVSLMPHVDGVIVVSRLELTTRDNARTVSALLARIPHAHPIGVLVNDVPKSEGYGYYGYGYGDAESA